MRGTGHPWKEEGSAHGPANKVGGLDIRMTGSRSSKCPSKQS